MAALDVAGAIDNVKTMLSELSAWQAICAVNNSTDAAKRIYEGGVQEDPDKTVNPCIVLDIDPFTSEWMPSTSKGVLVVEIRTELVIPEDKRGSYATQYVWVWQQVAALLAGINANINDPGELMVENINLPLKPGPIDPGDNQGRIEWGFIIALQITLI